MKVELHEKLNAYLKEHCYNKSAIARAIGVDPRNFNAALNGKRDLKATELIDTLNLISLNCDAFFQYEPPQELLDEIRSRKSAWKD